MKKILAIIVVFMFSSSLFSQTEGFVKDNDSKKIIPYTNIWVENENLGTTSDINGKFLLRNFSDNQNLIFSAVGYETKRIGTLHLRDTIYLIPKTIELKEVLITPSKLKEIKIGVFDRYSINYYLGPGIKPWIIARYFPYKEEYKETRFIKKLVLLTASNTNKSMFNIRLYSIGKNGEPENYIYNDNIFGIARKGNSLTVIDISKLNINFPEEGLFIAVEWLTIDKNKYEFRYNDLGKDKVLKGFSYEPTIGTISCDTDAYSWIYDKGEWRKPIIDNITGKYHLNAIEITLTNKKTHQ